ncbi:MAG: ABC transporter permease subunit [Candidatus Cloacimonetes bacterium]|nr:ABC transporter permease subunit [Candidatus Cloacimonadota bacterium]
MRKSGINLLSWLLLGGVFVLLACTVDVSFRQLVHSVISFPMFRDAAVSLFRVVVPLAVVWVLSIILGYLFWFFPSINRLCGPTLHFLRGIPPMAWLPFTILWFGIGEVPLFAVMMLTLLFPGIVGSHGAFCAVPREYHEEGVVCGSSAWQLFWWVELPLSLVAQLQSLRLLWGLGWGTLVAGEMLGVQSGLGFRLLDFRYLLRYGEMLVVLGFMGTLVLGVDVLLRAVIRRVE